MTPALRPAVAATAALAVACSLAPLAAQAAPSTTSAPAASAAPSSSATSAPSRKINPRTAKPLNDKVLWSENFDGQADATGFTHRTPRGWSMTHTGFSTGEARWAGWAFSNVRDWTWAVGTDRRHWFTGAHNTFAVVESEHQRLADRDRMTTGLTTPAIAVKGEKQLALRFDSHYAQGKAPQGAAVYVSFDGGAKRELLRYSKDRLSAHEDLQVAVPRGAKMARFTFSYEKGRNDKWWGVDNVALVRPKGEVKGAPLATFDVMSDIHVQGGKDADAKRNAKYLKGLQLFAAQKDKAGALALVGDITELGTAADYKAASALLKANPHASGKTLIGAGNHEYLGKDSFEDIHRRFLALTGRDKEWGEVEVNGIPALMFSTEYYSDVDRKGVEPYVQLGQQQLAWLESRLSHYAKTGTPVLLMNHHPLPQSVSFTHSAWYGNDVADLSALNKVIAKYDNVVYFSGHTHAWLGLNDWWGMYRVIGSGNPTGFPAVNTGAILNAGVPDGDNDESRLEGDHATGLRVKVYRDRVRVEAWDILTGKQMKHQDLPVTEAFAKRR